MRIHCSTAATTLLLLGASNAFTPSSTSSATTRSVSSRLHVSAAPTINGDVLTGSSSGQEESSSSSPTGGALSSLTRDLISKLQYREAKRELERLATPKINGSSSDEDESSSSSHSMPVMTLTEMRDRLRAQLECETTTSLTEEECVVSIDKEALDEAFFQKSGISFQDTSDPDFEWKDLQREIREKCSQGHWKTATRKLKRLNRYRMTHMTENSSTGISIDGDSEMTRKIPKEIYDTVLEACMVDRLHGARASEPTRRVMECMVMDGYTIDSDIANNCIKNCVSGSGPHGTHDGFGGIDTALAMLAACESTSTGNTKINVDTYESIISAMAKEGGSTSLDDALSMTRSLVVDKSETPSLDLFATVAKACVDVSVVKKKGGDIQHINSNVLLQKNNAEKVLTLMAYIKAAGYDLDNIASTEPGREILAAGVIASEILDNIPLGLRLLTAAGKAEGCSPDRGDTMVALSSSAAQRAATILHRRATNRAVQDGSWKLSVKLLEIMMQRSLTPSPRVWRNVVTCCAKAEKSRKATSLLLDWVKLYEQSRAEKPPIRVFNTVMNACEICGEEDLTVTVLEALKKTHDTDGNIITLNIALKRLAKVGNEPACEGLIIGMIQNGVEPSVVSYTTAIAACVNSKNSAAAAEWLKRMKMRRVQPNVVTYNTALAACLDGTYASTLRASQIAADMAQDVQRQVDGGILEKNEYTDVLPNLYTKTVARQLMKQLKTNWENGDIDRNVAKTTVRVPLLKLVEFDKEEIAEGAKQQKEYVRNFASGSSNVDDDDTGVSSVTDADEDDLEYSVAVSTHRVAAV